MNVPLAVADPRVVPATARADRAAARHRIRRVEWWAARSTHRRAGRLHFSSCPGRTVLLSRATPTF